MEAKELALGVIVMGGVRRVFGFAEARLHSCTSRGLNELKKTVRVSSTPVSVTQNDRDSILISILVEDTTKREIIVLQTVPDKTEKHVETILANMRTIISGFVIEEIVTGRVAT